MFLPYLVEFAGQTFRHEQLLIGEKTAALGRSRPYGAYKMATARCWHWPKRSPTPEFGPNFCGVRRQFRCTGIYLADTLMNYFTYLGKKRRRRFRARPPSTTRPRPTWTAAAART